MESISHLNVFSCYDFLNSNINEDKYLDFLKRNQIQKATVVTTNHLFGFWKFYQKGQTENIDFLPGLKIAKVKWKNNIFSLTVFPKTYKDYKKITILSSKIFEDSEKILNLQENIEFFQNLLIIFPINSISDFNLYEQLFHWMEKEKLITFGGLKRPILFDSKLKKYIENHYIFPFNPVYYLDNNQPENKSVSNHYIHAVLKAIKNQTKIQISNIKNLENHWFTKTEWIAKNNKVDLSKKILENLKWFWKEINFSLPNKTTLDLKIVSNKNFKDEKEYLKDLCLKNLQKKKLFKPEYQKRLNYELEIIFQKNITNYFLIIYDYVQFAIAKDILIGPGRGSAAGSLVSYLLDITKVDPIENRLLFERFLNPERIAIPDVDLDFEDQRRIEILNYLWKKYGQNHISQVLTFQKIAFKTAIRDIGRILDIPLIEINRFSKAVPLLLNNNFDAAIKESYILQGGQKKYPWLFKFAKEIIGLPRQTGIHAAGVVISEKPLNETVGILKDSENKSVLQLEMTQLHLFGLVKMDLLGLKNLTIISKVLEQINIKEKKNQFLNNLPINDKKTFLNLQRGNTLGIFQLESPGMTSLLKRFKPEKIDDIAAVISLYRPGALDSIDNYLKRRFSKEKSYSFWTEFDELLKVTHGIPIYQEQIIEMVKIFANLSFSKGEILRKALSKKDLPLITSIKKTFFFNAKEKKYPMPIIEKVWNKIVQFSYYGFNRSHAVSYAYLVYWMSYLKFHYFPQFMMYLLNDSLNDKEKTRLYLKNLKVNGILIEKPNVNFSSLFYNLEISDQKKTLWIPLTKINQIGSVIAQKIIEIREKDGNFKNLFNFIARAKQKGINKKTLLNLINAGALDGFGYNRKTLRLNLIKILNQANFVIIDEKTIDWNLMKEYYGNWKIESEQETKIDYQTNCQLEINTLGFLIDFNYLKQIKKELFENQKIKLTNLLIIENASISNDREIFQVLVFVEKIKIILTKTNKEMAYLLVSDAHSTLNLIVWSSQWNEIKIEVGQLLLIDLEVRFYSGYKDQNLMRKQFIFKKTIQKF